MSEIKELKSEFLHNSECGNSRPILQRTVGVSYRKTNGFYS
jgi:hypothetical protein